MTKWARSGWVVLRVRTDVVSCIHDGGLWITEEGWYDDRPADCHTAEPIPPGSLEVQLPQGTWRLLRG